MSAIDLTSVFDLKRLLSGGKSGAYLFTVEYKQDPKPAKTTYVLKLYPDGYERATGDETADTLRAVQNERPFREMLTLCKMSGTEGFPRVFDRGCARFPTKWMKKVPKDMATVVAPFVVMSTARGVPLANLNLSLLTTAQATAIAMSLLALLLTARARMGNSFEHFDFHPDNIFIDMDCTGAGAVETDEAPKRPPLRVSCPQVSLIDFDLVRADETFAGLPQFAAVLPEQTAKRNAKVVPVPERTLEFALRWLGELKARVVFQAAALIPNTDMRNWAVIVESLFAGKAGVVPRQLCKDVTDCVLKNYNMFSAFMPGRTPQLQQLPHFAREGILKAEALVEEAEGAIQNTRAKVTRMFFEQLLAKADANTKLAVARAWRSLDAKEVRQTGGHLTYDTVRLLINTGFTTPVTLQALRSVSATFQELAVIITFKQLNPVIKINTRLEVTGRSLGLAQFLLQELFNFFVAAPTAQKYTAFKERMIQHIRSETPPAAQAQAPAAARSFDAMVALVPAVPDTPAWIRINEVTLTFEPQGLNVHAVFALNPTLNSIVRAVHAVTSRYNIEQLAKFNLEPVAADANSWSVSVLVELQGPPNPCVTYAQSLVATLETSEDKQQPCIDFINQLLLKLVPVTSDNTLLFQILTSRKLYANVQLASRQGAETVVDVERSLTAADIEEFRHTLLALHKYTSSTAMTEDIAASLVKLKRFADSLERAQATGQAVAPYALLLKDVNQLLERTSQFERQLPRDFNIGTTATYLDSQLKNVVGTIESFESTTRHAEKVAIARDQLPLIVKMKSNVKAAQMFAKRLHLTEMQRTLGAYVRSKQRVQGVVGMLKSAVQISQAGEGALINEPDDEDAWVSQHLIDDSDL